MPRGRGTDSLAILRKHLAGWENLRRPDGTLVEFVKGPDGGPRDELLYLLPPDGSHRTSDGRRARGRLRPVRAGEVRAAVHLRYGGDDIPRCRDCSDPAFRREFGCDESAERAAFSMTCSRCSGGSDECATCGGSGIEDSLRCPASMVTPAILGLLDTYRALRDGHLPAPGAWLDQSAGWARWMRIIEAEVAKIEEERAKRARKRSPPYSAPRQLLGRTQSVDARL